MILSGGAVLCLFYDRSYDARRNLRLEDKEEKGWCNMGSVINLDKLISSMIHFPKVDGIPLYTRVDNQIDEYIRSQLNKSPKWVEYSKRIYGSPDNIRRVFITYKGVYVHLYRPVAGGKDKSLVRKTLFSPAFDVVYNDIMTSAMTGARSKYKVRQYGLRALYKPWVCSNVEEVYFDWTLFLSEDIRNIGFGDLLMYYKSGEKSVEPIKTIFEAACLSDGCKLADRYPRLKCIGYISSLEEIYNAIPIKPGADSLDDMMKPWYNNNVLIEAVRNGSCNAAVYDIPGVPKLNAKYSVKDGIYLFDRDVLKDYFLALEERIKQYQKGKRLSEVEKQKEELIKKVKNTKSGLELLIDEIYAKEGAEKARLALRITFDGLKKSEIEAILNEMSTEGNERYRALLGL